MSIRKKRFLTGFVNGVLIIIAANLYIYQRAIVHVCADCVVSFGIPLRFYFMGGFVGEGIWWTGLIADTLAALCLGAALGWVWQQCSEIND